MYLLSIPILSDIENLYNNLSNAFRKRPDLPPGTRTVVYAVKNLAPYGGLETRLLAYAAALTENGHRVVFVTERNRNREINAGYTCLHLNFHARNFPKSLGRIIAAHKVDVVGFQIKNRRSVHRLDLEALKKQCRIGCVVHGEIIGMDTSILRSMDYRIVISDRLLTIDYAHLGHYVTLPNAIDAGQPVWAYRGQRKALIVSRLQNDKFMQLCAAIEFCTARGIPFEIAGRPVNSATTKRLKRRYALRSDVFAPGAVNTREFLERNTDRYLFVAGVGQVLLEAGAAGFPCLLASDKGAEYSTFLTGHNIRENYGRNLTLAHPVQRHVEVRVPEFDPDKLKDYDISGIIREDFSFSRRFNEYLACIRPEIRSSDIRPLSSSPGDCS